MTDSTVRVRFAPSPSGFLHIGGARTALFNWLWARRNGGQFILRVEDTDQDRSSIESVQAILDAMKWLGLDWDEGPDVGGPHGPYFQSERRARYREVADQLVEAGKAYRCYATKDELDAARAALKAENPKAQFRYPGWWREKGPADWREGEPYVVRFKSPSDGATAFDDEVFGTISTPNDQQQDFVILRSDGFPLYNLACVVDDHDMDITLVARGRDHIGNTPQQLLLYGALDWAPPKFAHLPMMLNNKGAKLSKRHADVAVQDYKNRGFTPSGVLNYLVRFGWSFGDQEIFSVDELREKFDFSRVGKSDGKFDEKKFADVAFEHLKQSELMPLERYVDLVTPRLAERGLSADAETLQAAIPLIRERARDLKDAAWHLDFYFRDEPEFDAKAQNKFLKPEAAPHLSAMRTRLADAAEFAAEPLEASMRSYVEESGAKMKLVAQPLRVALTGRTASPPLFDVMVLLGREQSLRRIDRAIELAKASNSQ